MLTEWKVLFIQFRRHNGTTLPCLLLRQPAGSFEFCKYNVFTLLIRMFAVDFESVQF